VFDSTLSVPAGTGQIAFPQSSQPILMLPAKPINGEFDADVRAARTSFNPHGLRELLASDPG